MREGENNENWQQTEQFHAQIHRFNVSLVQLVFMLKLYVVIAPVAWPDFSYSYT